MKMTSIKTASLCACIAVAAFCSWALATGRRIERTAAIDERSLHRAPAEATSNAETARGSRFLGVVLARVNADIAPRVEARLREVKVRLGDRLAQGAPIATLEAPSIGFALSIAEASLLAAEIDHGRASLELAEMEERFDRRRNLLDKNLVSREEASEADYKNKLARSRANAAGALSEERRAEVNKLKRDLEDMVIRAPFDAIVAARYLDPGVNVSPATPIVRLIAADDLFVRFAVPEEQASRIAIGMEVTVQTGGDRGVMMNGAVDKIAPEVDVPSRMVFIEAWLEKPRLGSPVLAGALAWVSARGAP